MRGPVHVACGNSAREETRPETQEPHHSSKPVESPDEGHVAFVRGRVAEERLFMHECGGIVVQVEGHGEDRAIEPA